MPAGTAARGQYSETVPSRLGSLPILGALKRRPAVVRAFGVVHRARMVDQPVRFALREWRRSAEPARYRPHGAAVDVFLRHGTSDLDILDEVFGRRLYRIPAPARAALAAAQRPLHVLDLGGHIGLFGAWIIGEADPAQIVAVEPDAANAGLLRRTIAAGSGPARWSVLPVIAAARDARLPFVSGAFAESHVPVGAAAAEAPLREARDVLPLMAEADLVKIDIEGGEWSLLMDPRFAALPTRALVIEYHPASCPSADARAFITGLLRDAGYRTEEIDNVPIGAGMLWAWRETAQGSGASRSGDRVSSS
jgi:FkbM family methyltransferase